MRLIEARNSLVEVDSDGPGRVDLDHPHQEHHHQQREEAAAHEAVAQVDVDAGDQHEDEGDRQALVAHIGREQHARHRQIDGGADDEQHPEQRMDAQQPVPHRPHRAGHDQRDQRQRDDVGIALDDVDQPVDLAEPLPVILVGEAERRAREQQRDRRQERNAGGAEVDEPHRQRLAAAQPKPMRFDRQQADAVDAERRQVAEEQREREHRRHAEAQRPVPLAQGDPAGHRPQRQADAENVVGQADQEDVIVQERRRDQRERRPAAEQRAVERQRARQHQRQHRQQEELAGEIDAHDARQHRHDQVHHQVRDRLPVDLIEARQVGIVGDRGDDVHAREVVDVVRQRRDRVGPDRDRDDQQQQAGQHGDIGPAERQGPPRAGRPPARKRARSAWHRGRSSRTASGNPEPGRKAGSERHPSDRT